MRKTILSISLILSVSICGFANAQFLDDPNFGEPLPKVRPQLGAYPELIYDGDDEVCSGYKAAIDAAYLGDSFFVDAKNGVEAWSGAQLALRANRFGLESDIESLEIINSPTNDPEHPLSYVRGKYALAKYDIDQDGALDGLLFHWRQFGSQGEVYAVNFIPTKKLDEAESFVASDIVEQKPIHAQREADKASLGRLNLNGEALSTWLMPTFIMAPNGKVYVNSQRSYSFPPDEELYIIKADKVEKVCSVKSAYEAFGFDTRSSTMKQFEYEMSDAEQSIFAMANHLRKAQGEECNGGTMHPLRRLQLRNRINRFNLIHRPWAKRSQPYNSRERLKEILQKWSYKDAWSKKVYDDIVSAYPILVNAFDAHLKNTLGVGEEASRQALAHELAYHFVGVHFVARQKNAYDDRRIPPHSSLVEAVQDGSINPKEIANSVLERTKGPLIEFEDHYLLTASLDQVEVLEALIAAGLNPDANNEWGKTPLMFAVQLGKTGAVEFLIANGADVNAKADALLLDTNASRFSCNIPSDRSRTPLRYAIDERDFKMVKMLVSKGARDGGLATYSSALAALGEDKNLSEYNFWELIAQEE